MNRYFGLLLISALTLLVSPPTYATTPGARVCKSDLAKLSLEAVTDLVTRLLDGKAKGRADVEATRKVVAGGILDIPFEIEVTLSDRDYTEEYADKFMFSKSGEATVQGRANLLTLLYLAAEPNVISIEASPATEVPDRRYYLSGTQAILASPKAVLPIVTEYPMVKVVGQTNGFKRDVPLQTMFSEPHYIVLAADYIKLSEKTLDHVIGIFLKAFNQVSEAAATKAEKTTTLFDKPTNLTLTEVLDDSVFASSVSKHEYPSFEISEVNGNLSVGLGMSRFENGKDNTQIKAVKRAKDIFVTITQLPTVDEVIEIVLTDEGAKVYHKENPKDKARLILTYGAS